MRGLVRPDEGLDAPYRESPGWVDHIYSGLTAGSREVALHDKAVGGLKTDSRINARVSLL